MWHETARVALEKGQPLPPPPTSSWEEKTGEFKKAAGNVTSAWNPESIAKLVEVSQRHKEATRWQKEIKAGIILIAVGAGLYYAFDRLSATQLHRLQFSKYFGAIPAFIGAALILAGLLDALFSPKNSDPGAPPPQS
jgi:hypothetical protein